MTETEVLAKKLTVMQPKKRPLFFDIETAVHPDIDTWIKPPDDSSADDLAEYRDKIAKAPLDPDLGVIRSIAYREGIDGIITVLFVPNDIKSFVPPDIQLKTKLVNHLVEILTLDTEADMIRLWWEMFQRSRRETVGYNSIGFDFPYLLQRSMDLRIKPSVRPDLRRYQFKGNMDLMSILTNWTWGKAKSMKFLCNRYGIENPNPELDGSMVSNMDEATLIKYAAGDIYMLTEIYLLMVGVYF